MVDKMHQNGIFYLKKKIKTIFLTILLVFTLEWISAKKKMSSEFEYTFLDYRLYSCKVFQLQIDKKLCLNLTKMMIHLQ